MYRMLQGEYRRLKWKHEEAAAATPQLVEGISGLGLPIGQQDEELLAEARVLRQHKSRLETRMQILEDHNKQLESQLHRLRELLLQVGKHTFERNENLITDFAYIKVKALRKRGGEREWENISRQKQKNVIYSVWERRIFVEIGIVNIEGIIVKIEGIKFPKVRRQAAGTK